MAPTGPRYHPVTMPVYEYRCRACGHEFEIQQAMSDDPLTVCPECGGELRKVFSPVGIAFKGSGFYKTDSGSRSGSKTTTSADGGSSSATSGSDSTTSTDTKPPKSGGDSAAKTSSAASTSSD